MQHKFNVVQTLSHTMHNVLAKFAIPQRSRNEEEVVKCKPSACGHMYCTTFLNVALHEIVARENDIFEQFLKVYKPLSDDHKDLADRCLDLKNNTLLYK